VLTTIPLKICSLQNQEMTTVSYLEDGPRDRIASIIAWIACASVGRVKQAIAKKEETLCQLREQHDKAVKRADHLEDLLEQQRKQLLLAKK